MTFHTAIDDVRKVLLTLAGVKNVVRNLSSNTSTFRMQILSGWNDEFLYYRPSKMFIVLTFYC